MKRTLVVFGLGIFPATVFAQVPIYPGAGTVSPPTSLDPTATGTQAPPPPPTPVQSNKPNIIVVKPDGTITNSDDAAAAGASPNGYYVDQNPGAIPLNNGDSGTEVHAGAVPELHVVRSGDTLWDICWYYFNDPWQWPKIWSYNAQITNPHWIYPGDLVRLLPRGVFAQTGNTEPEKGGDVKPIDKVPPPEKRTNLGIKQLAFVEQSDLDKSITIDGALDEKELLGPGDSVYLTYPSNNPPQVGQTYSVYIPGNQVKGHGSFVHILGEVKVISVKQDKRARGVIVSANREIERGAKVGLLIKQFKNVPPVAAAADVQGTIVAKLSGDQLIGEGEVVFIDQGKGSGLEVGNRMYVVRRGDGRPHNSQYLVGQDDKRFPARELGRVLIVEIGDKISIGLVTLSVQEIEIGDPVMQQKE